MSVDKKIDYVEQDGYNNYIKNSDSVTVPRKFKSRKNATPTKLAYITDAEAKQLKKQNKGTPHKGPSGIPSYDSFDAQGNFTSGSAMSAMESGSTNSSDRAEVQASNYGAPSAAGPGVKTQAEQDIRSAAINAGAGQRVNAGFFDSRNTISPAEVAMAKAYRQDPTNRFARGAYKNTRGGGLGSFISGGGLLGGIIRNVGRSLGFGKNYNEPTYNMSNFNSLGLHANRFPSGFGIPTLQGDYDVLGNKINEITGEIISPTGESLGFLDGYPGGTGNNTGGITTIFSNTDDDNGYIPMLTPEDSTMPEDEELLGDFKSRFLQNRTQEEREAIEKMINEKFNYKYGNFGLGEYDGS